MIELIVGLIKEACALNEEVTYETELEFISLDSLTFVGVLVEMEKLFDIEFELDELNIANWKTVGDICQSVEGKIQCKETK